MNQIQLTQIGSLRQQRISVTISFQLKKTEPRFYFQPKIVNKQNFLIKEYLKDWCLFVEKTSLFANKNVIVFVLTVGGMSRPSKSITQAKKVAPPAVPDVFRHSGSSFGSAGYASSEDGCFSSGVGPGDDGTYGMPPGKSPGPIFTHPGFSFPTIVGKYSHAEDQGTWLNKFSITEFHWH